MLHRNKLLFRSYTEKELFRVTTQKPSIFDYLSLIPEKDLYSIISTSDRGFMYQIFPYRCIRDFCLDNVMENGCEKETFISSLLLFNIVFHLGTFI